MAANRTASPIETAREYLTKMVHFTSNLKINRNFEFSYGREVLEHPNLGPVAIEIQMTDWNIIFAIVVPALNGFATTESFDQMSQWIRTLAVEY